MRTPWRWYRDWKKQRDDESIAKVTLLGYRFVPYVGAGHLLIEKVEGSIHDAIPQHWGCMNDKMLDPEMDVRDYKTYLVARCSATFKPTPGACARDILKRRKKAGI